MPIETALPDLNRRRAALPNPRRKLPKNLPIWLFPLPIETIYRNALLELIDAQNKIIQTSLIPHLPSIALQRNEEVPEQFRADDYSDSVEELIAILILLYASIPINIEALVTKIGADVSIWNEVQYQKLIKSALGVNLFQREPFLNAALNSFIKENVTLINKMTTDQIDSIEGIMQRGFRTGLSSSEIATQIEKQIGVTKNKARFIARDQVGKLNGQLTGMRQTNLGITKYKWRTQLDNRVRPNHRTKEGVTFFWDNAPADTGHPGEDFQCRCHAEPDFSTVFEELQ